MRLIIEVKNPTEELTGHILFTLVVGYFACAQYEVKAQVGYFACAQYDVLRSGGLPRHFVPRNDTEIKPFGNSPSREFASLRSQRQ